MPSVRVRKSQYSTLQDPANGERPPIPGTWQPPSPSTTPQTSPIIAPALPSSLSLNQNTDSFNTAPRLRPRSGSLVGNHVIRRPRSQPLLHTYATPGNNDTESIQDSPRPPTLGEPVGLRDSMYLNAGPATQDSRSDVTSMDVEGTSGGRHHHDDIVEHLDVIDPEVATISNLTNAANSILIPPLSFYSRKPVIFLRPPVAAAGTDEERPGTFEDDLDRHVDDVLSRPAKIRRTLQGVWSFLKTPMGILTGIYGFCVVFWGAAIVFFLAKFIDLHNPNTQGFWVEVSSQVVNGLFTVTGVGLIPSRVLDSYRVSKIYHYKRKTRKLRKKAGLPQLLDVDDLPDPVYDPNYVHVLTEEEQADLHHQQAKFQYSQTWYRAHGTETHRAFPIGTALTICCLNDGNSIFQVMLCGTMWGLNRFDRPAWSTGLLIPASFLCGIFSAVFIGLGSKKTKRTDKVRAKLREILASEVDKGGQPAAQMNALKSAPVIMQRVDEEEPNEKQHQMDNDELEKEKDRRRSGVTDVEVLVDEHMSVPALVPPEKTS